MTCCLCGAWTGDTEQSLVGHLLCIHNDDGFDVDHLRNWCSCPCSGVFRVGGGRPCGYWEHANPWRPTLAEHLKERGGLVTHLLEIALGGGT